MSLADKLKPPREVEDTDADERPSKFIRTPAEADECTRISSPWNRRVFAWTPDHWKEFEEFYCYH